MGNSNVHDICRQEQFPEEKMGWRPIETAPLDGREMLIYLGTPWSRVEKARYYQPWNNWQVGIVPSDPVREEYYGIGVAIPTHWMPLPDPPKENPPTEAGG